MDIDFVSIENIIRVLCCDFSIKSRREGTSSDIYIEFANILLNYQWMNDFSVFRY